MQSILHLPHSDQTQATRIDLPARLSRIAEASMLELAPGDTLFRQGDAPQHVYGLLDGRLQVSVTDAQGRPVVQTYIEPGSLVGELALWTGRSRSATVQAQTAAHLVRVPLATCKQWLRLNPDVHKAVAALALPRIRQNQLSRVLGRIFQPADAAFLEALHQCLTWRHFANGQVLFHQGEPGQQLYIVVNGRLRQHYTDEEGRTYPAGDVHPGEMAGEFALLARAPHTTTAVAVRETNVVALTQTEFESLCDEYPEAMLNLTHSIARRQEALLAARSRRPQAPATIALVPASPDVDVAAFTQALAQSLAPFGATHCLTAAQFDQDYGQQGAANMPVNHPAHPLLVAWMNDLECRYERLLYVADSTWTEWTRRCLRQADRVLIVANAAGDPTPGLLEKAMANLGLPVRFELVLLHEPHVEQPQNTAVWLEQRNVHTHYHVRQSTPEHVARLARRLTGNAITLVLSGGAARGYAHLGVFQALQELNVPIDMIAGTSMGALMGAAITVDWDFEKILSLSHQFANPKALFDYTLPLVSFMASEKVTNMLKGNFGERRIEDMWRPFFAVSANLTQSGAHIHQTGLLWHAVRASISIPGIFAPVQDHNGDILVDGGIINNFPVDLMRQQAEGGQIIGVHVNGRGQANKTYDFDPAVSGWEVLWRRVNPMAKPMAVPSLFGYLMRAAMLNSTHHNQIVRQQTDLLIEPDVHRFGMMAFERYREIIQAGYEAARPRLAAWTADQTLLA